MTTRTRNIIRIVVGIALMAVGAAGLVLPILPGWLFLAPGIFLLAPNVPVFQRFHRWLENKFPPFKRAMNRMEPRLQRWGLDPNGPEYLEREAERKARRAARVKARCEARAQRQARRQESRSRLRPATSR